VGQVRHRTRLNRREVTVPYRVLPDSEVASCLGCPLPVRPRRPLNARSCRYSFLRPRPRMRLLGHSSHGVRLSYTAFPEVSAAGLSTGGTSRGFLPLQRSKEERVHVRPGCPGRLSGFAGVSARGSHSADYGVAHRFSQPLSDFFLSPPPRHFQTGGVHGVRPTGVCSFHEAPTTRRRRPALMTFFPRAALPRS
jgi:hypothetical protein